MAVGSKGKMLHLLKEKTKIAVAHKERKKYEALMPVKRIKDTEVIPQVHAQPKPLQMDIVKSSTGMKKITPKIVEKFDEEMKK